MKMLMRISVEVEAPDPLEAARQRQRFQEAASTVLGQFPQAALRVRPVERTEQHARPRPAGGALRVRRPSGAVLGYRD